MKTLGYKGLYSQINYENNLISEILETLHNFQMEFFDSEGEELKTNIQNLEKSLFDLSASNTQKIVNALK